MAIIYIFTNINNDKMYIGKTMKKFNQRFLQHLKMSKKDNNSCFHKAINKYGIDGFVIECLQVSDNLANLWERHLISRWKTRAPYGYNLTGGGEGVLGFKHSDATKKYLSEIKKGHIPWNIGIPRTKETKDKISKANKGNESWCKGKKLGPHSEAFKQLISTKLKGRISWTAGNNLSEEHRKKITEGLLKIRNRVYKITTPDGNIITVDNLKLFSRLNNLDSGSMCRVANGIYKHHKGYNVEII
jgi:group I intron endonuclease